MHVRKWTLSAENNTVVERLLHPQQGYELQLRNQTQRARVRACLTGSCTTGTTCRSTGTASTGTGTTTGSRVLVALTKRFANRTNTTAVLYKVQRLEDELRKMKYNTANDVDDHLRQMRSKALDLADLGNPLSLTKMLIHKDVDVHNRELAKQAGGVPDDPDAEPVRHGTGEDGRRSGRADPYGKCLVRGTPSTVQDRCCARWARAWTEERQDAEAHEALGREWRNQAREDVLWM
jgi:hypothetical protein